MIYSILIAYLFLYLIFHFLADKKWLKAHQKAMSIFALLFLIYTILNIIQQWYSGYLYESIAFSQRAFGGYYLWVSALQTIIFILPILNFKPKNSAKKWLQWLINSSIIGYLIMRYIFSEFSVSVIPGWHTTIYPSLSIYSLFTTMMGFILLNFLSIRFILDAKLT